MSDPNSTKGYLFKKTLNAKAIKYRDCKPEDLIVSDCIERIEKEIRNDSKAILIGSSLGGLLAAKTALNNSNVKQIILLNPAIIPPYFDITKIKDMPHRILLEMKDKKLFEEKLPLKIFIIIGTKDDVVPNSWPIEFAKAQEATVLFLNDDHSFSQKLEQLPHIITNILNKNIKR
jgi:predicted esterase YcpF (UPF0227 family)